MNEDERMSEKGEPMGFFKNTLISIPYALGKGEASLGSTRFEKIRKGISGTALGVGLSFAVSATAIGVGEFTFSETTSRSEYDNHRITTKYRAVPTIPALLTGAATNPVVAGAVQYFTREPKTETTISGQITTPYVHTLSIGDDVLNAQESKTIDYTCTKRDGEWSIMTNSLPRNLSQQIRLSLERRCQDVYDRFNKS